jgi:dienelactone hydrolase
VALAGVLWSAACAPEPSALATGFFANGDVRLSYQLDTPAGRPPYPAVVIGHGSGEVRKEHCRSMASNMLRRGFATLCFDKRGVGQSSGAYSNVGRQNSQQMIPALGSDMAAAVTFLRRQPQIDGARVGLMGGSQAGWVIPVAAQAVTPAFMILLVGPTVSVGEEVYYSQFAETTTTPVSELSSLLATYDGPRGFDPRPILETLDVPGLWLLGEADRSIPTAETVAVLDDLIGRGRPYARVVYPGAGHTLAGADYWPDIDRWLDGLRH